MATFQPGQVWTYHTRTGEEASRVLVLTVDRDPGDGYIIHVRVEGVAIRSPSSPGELCRAVGHMPVAERALEASVREQVDTVVDLPDYREAYARWRAAYDAGEAGIFDVTIAEALSYMEEALAATVA